ncbi:MAG: hypothetical protein D3909_09700, partial [Candidatus Electrothrix sp. ATG1]|nr:hypothetical protein [Candidatus Electrothrix sp. ATG1]
LKAVSLADIILTQKEEGKEEDKKKVWLLDGASKEETEQEAVDKLLNKVTAISVQSVLDPEKSAGPFKEAPAVQFTVTKQYDSKLNYAFAKNDDKDDDYFVLKMSDNELYFKVGKWLVEDLTEAKREKLLVGYEEEKEEKEGQAALAEPEEDVVQQAPPVQSSELVEQEAVQEPVSESPGEQEAPAPDEGVSAD